MGVVSEALAYYQIPVEELYGIGVAGPSARHPSEEPAAPVVQKENNEYADEDVGNNIDIKV